MSIKFESELAEQAYEEMNEKINNMTFHNSEDCQRTKVELQLQAIKIACDIELKQCEIVMGK